MEITKKLEELYNMINSIIIEKRIEEQKAGNLYFASRNNQLLDKEETFKKLNQSLDFLEEIQFEVKHELSKLHQPSVSGQLPLDFVKWYSGMEEEKILKAYERWKKEGGNLR